MNEVVNVGIINMYKEKGWTSFDVVAKMRGILGIKKIGHTGTLDPEAEGVLPVCIGRATKVVELITEQTKVYRATCKLGMSTDTQDHTGQAVSEQEVDLNPEKVRQTLMTFKGEIEQIPPMYSALNHKGRKLYDLAREGMVVERKPRKITVYDIYDIEYALPELTFTVICSKGTYIRTICHDLGEKLGVGAHMNGLIRTRVGSFEIDQALSIDALKEVVAKGQLNQVLLQVDELFKDLKSVTVNKDFNHQLYSGNKIDMDQLLDQGILTDSSYRVYDEDSKFIGIYHVRLKEGVIQLKPTKLFI